MVIWLYFNRQFDDEQDSKLFNYKRSVELVLILIIKIITLIY